jgi:hypothetical protein
MCEAAERFKPLTDEEKAEIAKRTEGLEPIFPQ